MRGLDDDDAERGARDQPVAAGKIARPRHVAERHFGNRAAMFEQSSQKVLMLRWIDSVMTAGQHRDGAAPDRGTMRRLIDAAREPEDDEKAAYPEMARQRARKFQPGAGSIARADDRDHRPHQRVRRTAYAEQ